jgi:hypothetical protein
MVTAFTLNREALMIHHIFRRRRPTPSLAGIGVEEELALLRVELMYGLRVDREEYLRRKVAERQELATLVRGRDAATILADLRGSLERSVTPAAVDLRGRRRLARGQDMEPA